jgi:hypothetical protein
MGGMGSAELKELNFISQSISRHRIAEDEQKGLETTLYLDC